ncbi:pre-mRNA-processing factor 19 [Capronia epimyces CBS 606.96]|uniref:Pre-mRNA-processing factor 19 n=1 Tax=Capronia epimyces CBS 606.96 TaxID=1182542 RepID=W9Y4C5_9EURO|nr:pre-mRNA-processing factor 19 [Capronia epimyces CBS 606.96]EXJ84076.1 pre-mRNA-processing factor 19 [Capronia epimyces CBS 606.96]
MLCASRVYEKRLIEAYISENGTEPETGDALSIEDLIELKTDPTVYPRPPQMTSIPAMLSLFQNEWDALALQTFTLQKELEQSRKELSVALYHQDAAVRMIAQLTKERDEARQALAKVSVNAVPSNAADGDAMQVDSAPLPAPIVEKIDSTKESLSRTRRKRPVPEDWASSDEILSYVPTSTSETPYSGGTVLSVHKAGNLVLVAGNGSTAGVLSLSEDRIVQSLDGGKGSVNSGLWAEDKAIIALSTGQVKGFLASKEIFSFSAHAGSATAVALHPSGSILASVGEDKSYILYDLDSKTPTQLTQVQTNSGLNCVQFHPDGHLLAAGGSDGQIKIFDVKSGSQAAAFELSGTVKCIYFSENGTWLAAVAQGSSAISIWDLRKGAEIKTIETSSQINSISWDYTGQYLAAAGADGVTVEQYSKATKEWSQILKKGVSAKSIAWGQGAHSLLTLDDGGALTSLCAAV